MNASLLEKISRITPEEQAILNGSTQIDRSLYYSGNADEIDSSRVLKNGKLIDVRLHTRFIHFPKHTHNYVELVYMAQGSTTHIIDGETIRLQQGDLLFLNQHATQEIYPAGEKDIAINFMILPRFFDEPFTLLEEDSSLKDFLISCLRDHNQGSNYLYFKARNIIPVQDLMEILIYNLVEEEPKRRSINQMTMSLLFLSLINHSENISVSNVSYDKDLTLQVLTYIENDYPEATLSLFAQKKKLDVYTISRIIRKETGYTFKQLLERKRLSQACFLLKNTPLTITEISSAIGYENESFFYRLFYKNLQMTPRQYRLEASRQA